MASPETIRDTLLPFVEIHDREMTEAAWLVWANALRGVDDASLKRAAEHVLKTSSFFPKPADFIRAIADNPTDRAAMAWQELLEAMHTHGSYKTISFTDPLVHAAVRRCGGWVDLCAKSERDLGFLFPKFVDAYQHVHRMGATVPAVELLPLRGLHDQQNSSRGLAMSEPIPVVISYTDRGLTRLEG